MALSTRATVLLAAPLLAACGAEGGPDTVLAEDEALGLSGSPLPYRSIAFGFNVGIAAFCGEEDDGGNHRCDAALERIWKDGIRDLRIMPLLSCSTQRSGRAADYVHHIMDAPARFEDEVDDRFRVLLTLSDFPYPTPNEARDEDESYPKPESCTDPARRPRLHEIAPDGTESGDLVTTWLADYRGYFDALETSEQEDLRQAYDRYHNIFPPASAYFGSYLPDLLSRIADEAHRSNLEIELFNEPDAPGYFAGRPGRFMEALEAMGSAVKATGLQRFCCGNTTRYVVRPQDKARTRAYHRELDPYLDGATGDVGFSFHLYRHLGNTPADFLSKTVTTEPTTDFSASGPMYLPAGRRIVTEFNTTTGAERWDPTDPALVYYLAELVAFAYREQIEKVYLFRLQDRPGDEPTLGFFDADGDPKDAYASFARVLEVVRDGYFAHYDDDSIDVIGRTLRLHAARAAHDFRLPSGATVVATSSGAEYGGHLAALEWVIFQRRRPRIERCRTGLTDCAGACVDTSSDARNCGACGSLCARGLECRAGACR